MTLKYFIIPITFVAALAVGAAPASAQHGGGGHMSSGGHTSGGHTSGGHVRGGGGSFHGAPHDSHFRGVNPRFNGGHGFRGPFARVRVVRPFHGPFFAFRPRFNLGFGLIIGYPVPYPWDYVAPYPYPYDDDPYGLTYDAPDDPGNSSTLADEQRDYGGMSFDITPGDANVLVDGTNVGTAQTFSPSSAPLTLTPGLHHVVIEKPGYQSMTFDSDVVERQVIPYQGTMQPQ